MEVVSMYDGNRECVRLEYESERFERLHEGLHEG
jgi:hypothetical protein